MKQRSTEIIQKVIRNNGENLFVDDFIAKYGISARTFRNDIKEINSFLHTISMGGIDINDEGKLVFQGSFDSAKVNEALYKMDVYTYKMSQDERQVYILIELIQNSHYMTMHHFAEVLLVSRVTIISDIEVIKSEIENFHGELLLNSGKGMKLVCSHKVRLELLIYLFRKIAINNKNDGYFQRFILGKMNITYSFSEIFTQAQEYMKVSNIVFIEDVFYDIVLYLFAAFNFANDRTIEREKPITTKRELNDVDHVMLYVGYMLGATVTDVMVEHFREYIEKNGLHSFVKNVDEVELYKVIMYFVSKVDEELGLGLSDDGVLIDSLLLHIKSMKDWGNYEVELPKTHDTIINYKELRRLVSENANILERFLGYQLSENMKKSIVIHICVAIIRNKSYVPKLSVIIACPGSMATGKYLEAQIKNYFDFHIVGVWTAIEVIYDLENTNEKVDFIISTVKIETDKCQVLRVNPFLTMEDLNMIQREIFKKETAFSQVIMPNREKTLDEIRQLLEDDRIADEVFGQLRSILGQYHSGTEKKKNAIANLLRSDFIIIDNQIEKWRDGMRASAKVLEAEHYIESCYIEKAIEHVEEFGDYIVVSNGVALAHSDKDSGVNQDALSVLVSKKGIEFSEVNHRVHLVFCFASTGVNEYLELIKCIVSIGKRPEKLEKILSLETKEEIYEEIIYN